MIYLDSSILLEVYLSQPRAAAARAVLRRSEVKISSWLLAIEVPVVLRRALSGATRNQRLLARALRRFDSDIAAINLYDGLPEVAARVRADGRLAQCRSLDALHVASALQIQEMAGHAVQVATFDERMAEVVRAVGLTTVPDADASP